MRIGIWELGLIFLIVMVLFGTKRLRTVGGDLGTAIKGFKTAMRDGGEASTENPSSHSQIAKTMFDVGFSEVLLIALVGLLVFGPERLPKLVREITFWVRKIRNVVSSARSEIERELQVVELRESLQLQRQTVEDELNSLELKPPSQWLPRPPGLEKSSES